jgi:hypothetical protein
VIWTSDRVWAAIMIYGLGGSVKGVPLPYRVSG